MSVVGCSHTFFVGKTTRPSGAKVEWSVPDASVPPTGVKTIRISPVRPPGERSPRWPKVLRRLVEPPASRLNPQSSYSTIK